MQLVHHNGRLARVVSTLHPYLNLEYLDGERRYCVPMDRVHANEVDPTRAVACLGSSHTPILVGLDPLTVRLGDTDVPFHADGTTADPRLLLINTQ